MASKDSSRWKKANVFLSSPCLVVAYVDDFLVDVDVQVDGFLHGEALCGERGLEVHILCRDLRHL